MLSFPKPTHKHERGQILVILALVFIGLVAIIGLAVDLGYYYVSYARLRRAVDSAALSATTQYKKNVDTATLGRAAREFLVMNGVPDTNAVEALVDTCDTDSTMCTTPPRKLVRVIAREDVPMFFMAILGLRSLPIEVSSTSEAAAVDLVLVMDRSESMGFYRLNNDGTFTEYSKPNTNLDPASCNNSTPDSAPDGEPGLWTGNCHPFHEVKSAAYDFVETFLDPRYDKVSLVVFDHEAYPINFSGDPANPVYLTNDRDAIIDAIRNLWMYDGFHDSGGGEDLRIPTVYNDTLNGNACPYRQGEPGQITYSGNPCRLFESDLLGGRYYYIDCAGYNSTPQDGTNCGSTNIGRGLQWASHILSSFGRREGALWVTILLTDGVPNAGFDGSTPAMPICPDYTKPVRDHLPFCRDGNANERHAASDVTNYDTDDYARDQADALAVGSLIFSIGLGDAVTSTALSVPSTPAEGQALLNYIADVGNTTTSYLGDPDDLQKIFLAIANKIATRLTQ